mmetsp:Transcript_3109/g.3598  ORF Transcript_3109/g.3598 Transcript_3109/m.3598 type:complete len:101 (+) Transcript_3109:184-486(+)
MISNKFEYRQNKLCFYGTAYSLCKMKRTNLDDKVGLNAKLHKFLLHGWTHVTIKGMSQGTFTSLLRANFEKIFGIPTAYFGYSDNFFPNVNNKLFIEKFL